MTEVGISRRPPLPRDLKLHSIFADLRDGTVYRGRGGALNEDMQNHWTADMSAEPREPLDEIATLVQALTYGEMIELSEAMWKCQTEGSAVTQETLPALLHRWSQSRSTTAPSE